MNGSFSCPQATPPTWPDMSCSISVALGCDVPVSRVFSASIPTTSPWVGLLAIIPRLAASGYGWPVYGALLGPSDAQVCPSSLGISKTTVGSATTDSSRRKDVLKYVSTWSCSAGTTMGEEGCMGAGETRVKWAVARILGELSAMFRRAVSVAKRKSLSI